MIIEPATLVGAFHLDIERAEDSRGYFARLWCEREFADHGIAVAFVQASVSHNALAGTLRGMHFQWPPSRESKLVRCERGAIFDAIIDLRPDSATFGMHATFVLDSTRRNALFIPAGFAHGFQTLAPDSDVVYMMSDFHRPDLSDGVRFDDPEFRISWPLPVSCINDRDQNFPDFNPATYVRHYSAQANDLKVT